ncbi:hypothetical protein G6F68_004039 [Rhizopus microsporus]|nr:hypothetical protein G6F67_003587 [Rhizopus microsporus]KAG1264848.1 hypothetical protein G6F68_004039 [Rhizopus microsporus]
MGFCGGRDKPNWKREIVSDHKFEHIDLQDFHDSSCLTRFKHFLVFFGVIKSFATYIADVWTAVSLLIIGQTTVAPAIPTDVSKWIFFACIMISFLLLLWDLIKARRILIMEDISYNFTCDITNTYLSIKDYRCFCLFQSIQKGIDSYAFFVYSKLKGWKRLLLAEAPRQVINIVTLEALLPEWFKIHNGGVTIDNYALGDTWLQQVLTGTMAFSVIIFTMSFALVCLAAVLYIPLMCHIRGNLKEYVCYKIDKRIDSILRKQQTKASYRKRQGPRSDESHLDSFPFHYTTRSPAISEKAYIDDGSSEQHLLGNDYFDYHIPFETSYQQHQRHQHIQRPASHKLYSPQLSQQFI